MIGRMISYRRCYNALAQVVESESHGVQYLPDGVAPLLRTEEKHRTVVYSNRRKRGNGDGLLGRDR